jgi:hypothetical protein
VGQPLHGDGLPEPQRLHPRTATPDALQPDRQRRSAQALRRETGGSARPPPGPAADVGQEGKHEVELLINRDRWLVRGVIRYVVRWGPLIGRRRVAAAGRAGALPGESHRERRRRPSPPPCPTAPGRGGPGCRLGSRSFPAVPPPAPLAAPVGFRSAGSVEVLTGSALVDRTVMFRWPAEGWVRGAVVRRSRAAGFSQ